VQVVRRLLTQRQLAVLICTATLLLKLLVPTGYMIDSDHGRITVAICSGTAPRTMTMAMPGMHGGVPDHGKQRDHGKAEMPCAFSGLSAAMLGAVNRRPKWTPHRRAKATPFVVQHDGYDGHAVRAGCGGGRA